MVMRIGVGGAWQEAKAVRMALNGQWVDPKTIRMALGGQWVDAGVGATPTVTAISVTPLPDAPYTKFAIKVTTTGTVPGLAMWANGIGIVLAGNVTNGQTFIWYDPANTRPRFGSSYTFTAAVSDGNTVFSRPDLTVTTSLPVPPAPSGLRVTDLSNTSIRVDWNGLPDLGFYNLSVSGPLYIAPRTVLGTSTVVTGTNAGMTWNINVAANQYGSVGTAASLNYTTKLTYVRGWYEFDAVNARTYSSYADKWRPANEDLFHGNGGPKRTPNHRMQHTSFYYWRDAGNDPFAALRGALDRGAVITDAQIYLTRKDAGYDKGIPVVVQTHNNKTWPGDGQYPSLDDNKTITNDKIRRFTSEWIRIPAGMARMMVMGNARGLHIGRDSSEEYFMNFSNNLARSGKLRIAIT